MTAEQDHQNNDDDDQPDEAVTAIAVIAAAIAPVASASAEEEEKNNDQEQDTHRDRSGPDRGLVIIAIVGAIHRGSFDFVAADERYRLATGVYLHRHCVLRGTIICDNEPPRLSFHKAKGSN